MKIRLFCLLSITSLIDASAQDTGNNGEFKRVDFMPKGRDRKDFIDSSSFSGSESSSEAGCRMRKNPLILDLEFSADDSSDGTLPEIVLTAPTPEALSRKVNTMEVLESSANPDQRLDEEGVNESIENRSQDGCCQRMVNFFRGCCGY